MTVTPPIVEPPVTHIDLAMYQRVACCVLGSAVAVMERHNLPVPDRRALAYWGMLGDPDCCDALLVKVGKSRPRRGASRCGPLDRTIDIEVRIFREACDPQSVCVDDHTKTCGASILCAGDRWPDNQPVGCGKDDGALLHALLMADRHALEAVLATEIRCCIRELRIPGCEIPCGYSCSDARWVSTEDKSGGGCAGSILKFEVDTIAT